MNTREAPLKESLSAEALLEKFAHYEKMHLHYRKQQTLNIHFWHRISLVVFLLMVACAVLTFISPFFLLAAIALFVIILFPVGKAVPNSPDPELAENLARVRLLHQLFTVLQQDLAPEVKIKAAWIPQPEDGSLLEKDVYRRKRSPHSGSTKTYGKKVWAQFKCELIDGSTLKIKCWDKLKKKGSYIMRFERLGQTGIQANPLLYEGPPMHQQRLLMGKRELSFYQSPEAYAHYILQELKQQWRAELSPRNAPLVVTPAPTEARRPEKTSAQPAVVPRPAPVVTPPAAMADFLALLQSSSLPLKQMTETTETLQFHYQPDFYPSPERLELLWPEPENKTALLRLHIRSDIYTARDLLLASPSLSEARFARTAEGTFLTCPTPANRQELEHKIITLSELAQLLSEKQLPTQLRSFDPQDITGLRNKLAIESKNLKMVAPLDWQEYKCKLHLELPGGRKQTVHLRFDRQDIQHRPLLCILSYCAPETPEIQALALEQNHSLHQSGLGLVKWGSGTYLSVCDALPLARLLQTNLAERIQAVAKRADDLEKSLTGGDRH